MAKPYTNGIRTIPKEEEEQSTLFEWAEKQIGRYPELALMFHIPNGGLRSKSEAARFKKAGVKPGVPDICLPVARHGFHGLWIEMKAMDGRVSAEQNQWIGELQAQENCVFVCHGFDEAKSAILWYLGGGTE